MNKTEQKAYTWLISQGIPEDVIVFQAHSSPDFIFTDRDVKYEVKRLYGRKILMRPKQLGKLKAQDNVTILVFSDESKGPIERIPVSELDETSERYGSVLIHFVKRALNSHLVQFECPVKLLELVDNKIKDEERHAHRTDLLLYLLRKYVEEK